MSSSPKKRIALGLLVFASASFGGVGCATKTTKVVDSYGLEVLLREVPSDRAGFNHPAIISPTRMLYILSPIRIEERGDDIPQRRFAIDYPILEPIVFGLVDALAKATPDQEVVVMAINKHMRLGIFHTKTLTSLVAFVRDDRLVIDFSRVDWDIPKEKEKKIPVPRAGQQVMEFLVVPERGYLAESSQTLSMRWRSEQFRRPSVIRAPEGEGTTSILMSSPIPGDEIESQDPPEAREGLSPDDLRALADLEEKRLRGEISERAYDAERARILDQ